MELMEKKKLSLIPSPEEQSKLQNVRKPGRFNRAVRSIRKNVGDFFLKNFGWHTSREAFRMSGSYGSRYRNPIVANHINNISDPMHRWLIANNDKIGKSLTKNYLRRAFQRDIGFFDGPEPEAELIPVNDDILAVLNEMNAYDWFYKAGMNSFVHGWQGTKPEFEKNKKGELLEVDFTKCYGEHEIPPERIYRYTIGEVMQREYEISEGYLDENGEPLQPIKLNDIKYYQLSFLPTLPLYRSQKQNNIYQIQYEIIYAQQMFHTTLGTDNYGFGNSVFEGVWDSIIKLAEQSENDHFRQSIFTKAVFNPDWSPEEAQDFMNKYVYAMNNQEIFGTWPIQDADGKVVRDIPDVNMLNHVQDGSPGKSSSGGGVFGINLSSEWANLTLETGYSIRYFTGHPGGALSAASEDTLSDVLNHISRFTSMNKFVIKPFLKMLQALEILPPANEDGSGLNFDKIWIKTWWEQDVNKQLLAEVGEEEEAKDTTDKEEGTKERDRTKNKPEKKEEKETKPKEQKVPTEKKENKRNEISLEEYKSLVKETAKQENIEFEKLLKAMIEVTEYTVKELIGMFNRKELIDRVKDVVGILKKRENSEGIKNREDERVIDGIRDRIRQIDAILVTLRRKHKEIPKDLENEAQERRIQILIEKREEELQVLEDTFDFATRENVSLETEADLDREIEKTQIDIRELEEAIGFELEEIEEEGKEKGVLRALQSQKNKFKKILQSLLNLKKDRFNVRLETEEDLDKEIAKTIEDINHLEDAIVDLIGEDEAIDEVQKGLTTSGAHIALLRNWRKFHDILQSLLDIKKDRFNVSLKTVEDLDKEIEKTFDEMTILENSMALLGHTQGDRIPKAQDQSAAIRALEREWDKFLVILRSLHSLRGDRFPDIPLKARSNELLERYLNKKSDYKKNDIKGFGTVEVPKPKFGKDNLTQLGLGFEPTIMAEKVDATKSKQSIMKILFDDKEQLKFMKKNSDYREEYILKMGLNSHTVMNAYYKFPRSKEEQLEFDALVRVVIRANLEPNKWLPVNSQSGNTKFVYYDPRTGTGARPRLLVQFEGGLTYTYPQQSNLPDPASTASMIQAGGTGKVWSELRASPGWSAGDSIPSSRYGEPRKSPARPGQTYPFAGQGHEVSAYDVESSPPTDKTDISSDPEDPEVEAPEQVDEEEIDEPDVETPETEDEEFPITEPETPTPEQPDDTLEGGEGPPAPEEKGEVDKAIATKPEKPTKELKQKSGLSKIGKSLLKPKKKKPGFFSKLFFSAVKSGFSKRKDLNPFRNTEMDDFFGIEPITKLNYGRHLTEKLETLDPELRKNDYAYWYNSMNKAAPILHKSKTTLYNSIKEKKEVFRINRHTARFDREDDEYWYAIVNGYSSANPFRYFINGKLTIEYQCPESIRNQKGVSVPLGIYHNLDEVNNTELPKWQQVGTYNIMEVIETEDGVTEDIAYMKVNKQAVAAWFEAENEMDWITPVFNAKKVPDISTAYPAHVHYDSDKKINVQTGFETKSVSFVPKGNCSGKYCTGDIVRMNQAIRACVQNEIAEIMKKNKKKMDHEDIIIEAFENCRKKD